MELSFSEDLDYSDDDFSGETSYSGNDGDDPATFEEEMEMENYEEPKKTKKSRKSKKGKKPDDEDFSFGNDFSSDFSSQDFPDFDNTKIDKLKKRITMLIGALLSLVVLSIIFTGYNLFKQKSQRAEIEEWVSSYLTENLNREMTEEELDRIAGEVSYRIYNNVPASAIDFTTLSDAQIYEMVAKLREPFVQTMTATESEVMAQKILVEYYRDKDENSTVQGSDGAVVEGRSESNDSDLAVLESRIEALSDNVKMLQTKTATAGAQGVQGPQGVKGETGAMGPQGLRGEKGERGETGATGAAGRDGQDGRDGRDGLQGEKGEEGKSAYESYVDVEKANGRVPLSESDWVESLKGKSYTDELKEQAKMRYEYFRIEVDAEFEALDEETKALYEDELDYYTQKYVKEQIILMLKSAGLDASGTPLNTQESTPEDAPEVVPDP